MLHDSMNISHFIVYAKHVKEIRPKRKSRDAKRARSFDGGSSMNRLEIQDKPRFKKRVPNQVPSKFPKASGDRVYNPKPMKVKGTSHQSKNQLVKSVSRSTMVIFLRGHTIVLVVVNVGTRLGISQI